jgi:hypothetical protein
MTLPMIQDRMQRNPCTIQPSILGSRRLPYFLMCAKITKSTLSTIQNTQQYDRQRNANTHYSRKSTITSRISSYSWYFLIPIQMSNRRILFGNAMRSISISIQIIYSANAYAWTWDSNVFWSIYRR